MQEINVVIKPDDVKEWKEFTSNFKVPNTKLNKIIYFLAFIFFIFSFYLFINLKSAITLWIITIFFFLMIVIKFITEKKRQNLDFIRAVNNNRAYNFTFNDEGCLLKVYENSLEEKTDYSLKSANTEYKITWDKIIEVQESKKQLSICFKAFKGDIKRYRAAFIPKKFLEADIYDNIKKLLKTNVKKYRIVDFDVFLPKNIILVYFLCLISLSIYYSTVDPELYSFIATQQVSLFKDYNNAAKTISIAVKLENPNDFNNLAWYYGCIAEANFRTGKYSQALINVKKSKELCNKSKNQNLLKDVTILELKIIRSLKKMKNYINN